MVLVKNACANEKYEATLLNDEAPHKQIRRHSLIASKSLLTKSTMQLSLDLFTERDIAKNRTPPLD